MGYVIAAVLVATVVGLLILDFVLAGRLKKRLASGTHPREAIRGKSRDSSTTGYAVIENQARSTRNQSGGFGI